MKKNETKIKISWRDKLLLKFFPKLAMNIFAKKMGMSSPIFNQVHEVFSKVNRVDILPSKSGDRGFQLILDGKTALYFYQDGDHFVYDGAEMGEYEGGNATIFDNLK